LHHFSLFFSSPCTRWLVNLQFRCATVRGGWLLGAPTKSRSLTKLWMFGEQNLLCRRRSVYVVCVDALLVEQCCGRRRAHTLHWHVGSSSTSVVEPQQTRVASSRFKLGSAGPHRASTPPAPFTERPPSTGRVCIRQDKTRPRTAVVVDAVDGLAKGGGAAARGAAAASERSEEASCAAGLCINNLGSCAEIEEARLLY
jgi:hypothetical protein